MRTRFTTAETNAIHQSIDRALIEMRWKQEGRLAPVEYPWWLKEEPARRIDAKPKAQEASA